MMDNVKLWKKYILNHIFYFKLKVTKVNLNQPPDSHRPSHCNKWCLANSRKVASSAILKKRTLLQLKHRSATFFTIQYCWEIKGRHQNAFGYISKLEHIFIHSWEFMSTATDMTYHIRKKYGQRQHNSFLHKNVWKDFNVFN